MHYIRFLSPPRVLISQKDLITIPAVVAVTTDLGDALFQDELTLEARLILAQKPGTVLQTGRYIWRPESHVIKFALSCAGKYESHEVLLHVHVPGDKVSFSSIVLVLDVWSSAFALTDKLRAEPLVERRLKLSSSTELRIVEEIGDSIARHIWDASLGFLQYLDKFCSRDENENGLGRLLSRRHERPLQVIELGAGCGIVGIAFAQLFKSDVLLTDLDDATGVLNRNVELAKPAPESSLRVQVLDWSNELDSACLNLNYDLVLVSDCIYNPDSSVQLVKVLHKLASQQHSPLILVGYKRRHTADQIFFDEMHQMKFTIENRCSIRLTNSSTDAEQTQTCIDFFDYRLSS